MATDKEEDTDSEIEDDTDSEIDADIQRALLAAKKAFTKTIDDSGWDIILGFRIEAVQFYTGEDKPVVHNRYLIENGMTQG